MKSAAKFLLGATLLAAVTAASAGEFVTVEIKGRVASVSDAANVLGGQVGVGQLVTGEYKYNIHAPDVVLDPNFGGYMQPDGRLKLTTGLLVFESDENATMPGPRLIEVEPSGNWPESSLRITSWANKPLPSGATVEYLKFEFFDPTGQVPATQALPTSAPSLHNFERHMAFVHGELNGQAYWISVQIESTYSDGMESDLAISPGKSTFVSGQRFDVALMAPPGSEIAHASARLDGEPLPMSFPGNCHLAPPNSQNRPTIICPDAHLHLPEAGGQYRIEWEVDLFGGKHISNPVEWTVVQ